VRCSSRTASAPAPGHGTCKSWNMATMGEGVSQELRCRNGERAPSNNSLAWNLETDADIMSQGRLVQTQTTQLTTTPIPAPSQISIAPRAQPRTSRLLQQQQQHHHPLRAATLSTPGAFLGKRQLRSAC
jgi:hypothetical protein